MRDTILTMSNRQALSVPVDDNLADTASTNDVPNPPSGENEPSGELPVQGMEWIVTVEENTGTPIQVEGTLLARLQISLDQGAGWAAAFTTENEQEMQLCEDRSAPDPCLSVNGVATRRQVVSHRFLEELGVTDMTQVRFRTVYSSSGRVGSDGAATVAATSYLQRIGGA